MLISISWCPLNLSRASPKLQASEMAEHAAKVIASNSLSDVVKVHHSKIEDLQLDEKVGEPVAVAKDVFAHDCSKKNLLGPPSPPHIG